MAPRRRGRPPKPRDSRMDAAIDAMKPFGFTEELVTAKMRQLLKEYEGEYMFIEADAYSVLLECLISNPNIEHNHQQIQQEVVTGETSNSVIVESKEVKDDHAIVVTNEFVDIPVCSSATHTVLPPPPSSPPPLPPPPPSSPPPPVSDVVLPPPPYFLPEGFPPRENVQPRRRKPCYGWICDDGDDDEEVRFIILPSSFNRQISPPKSPPAEPEKPQEVTGGRTNRLRGRRSRWDLRPEDM
ncbi:putative histone-lysine N-methyltransferase [Helianthus annuus]|uniref:Histone-lysine N-methyltransferase n=1 Tax=Helianthus annuus TaxID=4232 RepID=A0A251UE27_HELAN|nr:protein diaphanous homolog 1 [Helianthus annuus]XP_021973923.1 protein diaphanous homolog 1 [Helianthus annuus]KAF5800092.1 putative histone-lysine N-methyltransferase [Helianthus annuus]